MARAKLLVLDHSRMFRDPVKTRSEFLEYEAKVVRNDEEARRALATRIFEAALITLEFPGRSCSPFLEEIRRLDPRLPVIVIADRECGEEAVRAMFCGAYMYLLAPFDQRELLLHLKKALEHRRLVLEFDRLSELLAERQQFRDIVARSGKMQRVMEAVARIAGMDSPVHIHGESGTGQNLIARAIHLASDRRDRPFIAMDCAETAEALLERELFGQKTGSAPLPATGAIGVFARAQGGTVFLRRIEEMSLASQGKFLRVLQERQFDPGKNEQQPRGVPARIIVATNRDPLELIRQNLFRDDLFYRLHVIPIELPPLRERKEDIPLLAEHFLQKSCVRRSKKIKGLTSGAMQRLLLHDWPGNVREMENAIDGAVAMATQKVIAEELILPLKAAAGAEQIMPFREAREVFERTYLVRLLELAKGNVSSAATLAGRYRADLYILLKKHGLNPDDFRE
jgi:two-component system, NtrC family, response regulator GlrR